MSHTEQPRLGTRHGGRHEPGRPFHFSPHSQEDRIRSVFALPVKAPLPPVSDQAIAAYFDFLAENLRLPFDALYCPNGEVDMRKLVHYVKVAELLDPRQARSRNSHGLLCNVQNGKTMLNLPLAELGVREENPNCQLIDDYAYWFVNCRR